MPSSCTCVVDTSAQGWTAGTVIARTLAFSLVQADERVVFASVGAEAPPLPPCPLLPIRSPKAFSGENTLRRIFRMSPLNSAVQTVNSVLPQVALPITALPVPRCRTIGWIPDFQPQRLSQFFSDAQVNDISFRNERLAASCTLMWCSSYAVAEDFRLLIPSQSAKIRVASFPSIFAYAPPSQSTAIGQLPYALPEKFLLVVNQFWRHKNHRVVAEALGLLRAGGMRVPAVMVGMPADYRDKQNSPVSETLQTLAKNGAWPDCLVLGKVDRAELECLLRRATLLVQPSRFEGWNTTIEDAKALGCPVILSDLKVHREQCPDALGFFGCDDARALADIIATNWSRMPARPDHDLERKSLAAAHRRGLEFGAQMAAICREAAQ